MTSSGRFPSDRRKENSQPEYLDHAYPGPLVLPGDDLSWDPKHPAQSLRSWILEKDRNKVTSARKTIYIAASPTVAAELSVINTWRQSVLARANNAVRGKFYPPIKPPKADDIRGYLESFYHGMLVKLLPRRFGFVKWENKNSNNKSPSFIGLQYSTSCTRIRVRRCPDGVFERQLNLNDILDAEIEMLPEDAYAMLLLVEHDLYEDDNDDFCCGRAYGGSRVAVVSSARYCPTLDEAASIDHAHMWPASHCQAFVDGLMSDLRQAKRTKVMAKREPRAVTNKISPLRAAILATDNASLPEVDPHGVWLSRVVRTASHELGHCLALDHCVYYACVMQATGGIAEDVRQPPYLCPICMKKVTRAILDSLPGIEEEQYLADRRKAIMASCAKWKHVGMFAGLQAWIESTVID